MGLCEILYCGRLWKSVEKHQICFKSGKNIGHVTRRPKYVIFFSSDIKSPLERSLRLKRYQASRTAQDFWTLGERATLLCSASIICLVICRYTFCSYIDNLFSLCLQKTDMTTLISAPNPSTLLTVHNYFAKWIIPLFEVNMSKLSSENIKCNVTMFALL